MLAKDIAAALDGGLDLAACAGAAGAYRFEVREMSDRRIELARITRA